MAACPYFGHFAARKRLKSAHDHGPRYPADAVTMNVVEAAVPV
jgi:hypothetical protein